MNRHYSDDDLIARLYESDGQDSHLESCADCGERWRALQIRRKDAVKPVAISSATLAAQEGRILAALSKPQSSMRPGRLMLAPALAAALLAVGMYFSQPTPNPAPVSSESDAQLFTDIYAMEQELEPRAVVPVRALFEEER